MIKKIIIFSENNSSNAGFNFIKSASSLRISYMLRSIGYTVKQIHNCTSFNKDELIQIIDNFAKEEEILVCISSSFLSSKSLITNKSIKNQIGSRWGDSFLFFQRLLPILKNKKIKTLLGGWEILENKFEEEDLRILWGIDFLSEYIDYFVLNNNIDIIDKVAKGLTVSFKEIKGSKLAYSSDITDFSDIASTPIEDDCIFNGESLPTEIAAGCVFSCQFCNYGSLGKKKHEFMRSYESLEHEIVSNYKNYKTRVYLLTDNIVNDYDEKLKWLAKIRDKFGIDLRWVGYVRPDIIRNKDQVKLMLDSGIAGAFFGIESFKKEVGPYIGKLTDRDKLLHSLDIFRSVVEDNCLVSASFIAGLPTETKDETMKNFLWLESPEGRSYIDMYYYTSLGIFDNNNIKNEINAARNDPFKDYIKTSRTSWISPWGKWEEYDVIAKSINVLKKTNIGSFTLPFLNNLGMPPEESIKFIRYNTTEAINKKINSLKVKNNDLISLYKERIIK